MANQRAYVSRDVTLTSNNGSTYNLNSILNEKSYSVEKNTSLVSLSGSLTSNKNNWSSGYNSALRVYWHDDRENKDILVAEKYMSSIDPWATISASADRTVEHKDDGTLKGYCYVTFEKGGTSAYCPNSGNVGYGLVELYTIPRVSSPTLSATEAFLDTEVTINTNRKTDSFTHKIYYTIGTIKEKLIAENVGTSYKWKIPKDIANQIPKSDNANLTIKVSTYLNSTLIGSKELTLKVKIPTTQEFMPEISSVNLEEVGPQKTNINTIGNFVQNISKIKGTVNAKGAYSSTIQSYSISFNNQSFTASSFTTDVITLINPKLSVTVTDSRGRKTTYNETVTVLEYNVPTILNFSCNRIVNDPTKIEVSFKCKIYTLNNKNTSNFVFFYKLSTENKYTQIIIDSSKISVETSGLTKIYTAKYNILTLSTDKSYNCYLKVEDLFNPVPSANEFIGTDFKLINISADRKNIAIGKLHERNGYNEYNVPAIYYENIYREDGDYFGQVLSCPDISNGKITFDENNKELIFYVGDKVFGIPVIQK